MSYTQYKRQLEKELDELNFLIDEKIMRGLSYRREAKRHKELIRQARRMRQKSFFARLLPALTLF